MDKFEKFFAEINTLKVEHKKEDLFNGFVSFGIGADETKHSRFIGMLLNPKGSHKQGDKFLRLFLEKLEITDFILEGLSVECEKSADGRRIDIALWNKTQFIVIENKFWAGDQDNQMRDYYNFALKWTKKETENVSMLYLTPYGRMPAENSYSVGETPNGFNPLPEDKVVCISYEKQILNWLEACVDSFSDSDNIRLKISLEMYVELIRKIINRDKYMNEIYNHLIENNEEKLSSAIDIINALQGRDFMSDSNKILFKERILNVADDYDPYIDPSDNSIVLRDGGETLCSIYFDGSEIYINDGEFKALTIDTKVIMDKRLQSLLINDVEGILDWINQIVDKFKSIQK